MQQIVIQIQLSDTQFKQYAVAKEQLLAEVKTAVQKIQELQV